MLRPNEPGVIRASIVVVSQFGHGGLLNVLMMSSLQHQAGAQYSQSPMDAEGEAVINHYVATQRR
jgi:hypothetical protein